MNHSTPKARSLARLQKHHVKASRKTRCVGCVGGQRQVKTHLRREHAKLDVVQPKQQLDQLLADLKPTRQY